MTINLAIYGAVYVMNGPIFTWQGIESKGVAILLFFFLILVNYLLTVAYLREHSLNEIISNCIKRDFVESNEHLSDKLLNQKDIVDRLDRRNRKKLGNQLK